MVNNEIVFNFLASQGINFYCGVPDSLLKNFCAYITDHTNADHHTIAANEGNAIALACGHFLATGLPALVYMQNSGLGNCVNPLLSLADKDVYNIPLLMFIGWRGEPGIKDEPQHVKQGKVTDKLLEAMGIKYSVLPEDTKEAITSLQEAILYCKSSNCPFAFLVKKGTFEQYKLINKRVNGYTLKREKAIETVVKYLSKKDIIISTTGMISRELYEIREKIFQTHASDFLTVGSMGHSSSIALGIALHKKDRNVFCFDGDGAFLMHQGALAVIASKSVPKFKHIVFNNEAHDSVGGQPTVIVNEDIVKIASDSGYKTAYSVNKQDDLEKILPKFINEEGPSLLEIKVSCGARSDLGRPKEKPTVNKSLFMEFLKND